jgi:retrograde regulation protein 2
VPENQIRIIATEATREAINSEEFVSTIKKETDLTVELLPKEEEGHVGALGIASSFSHVGGLVMDLGGGSTQITWMIANGGNVEVSPKGAFSFPYGAAAMTRILEDIKKGKSKEEAEKAKEKLRQEMAANFRDAYQKLEVPNELVDIARMDGGFHVYLSGGGFRGWGYLLLYQSQVHGHHYPISIINGFTAGKDHFENTDELKEIAKTAHKIFRVSDRRRSQVPAVAFLVSVLSEAIPYGIKEARFCQGGVREGILFQELPHSIRKQDPLEVATAPFARPSAHAMAELFIASIPVNSRLDNRAFPTSISFNVVRSLANVFFQHSDLAKESSSAAALYSTTTGILAAAHGVSHMDRALLALMFEERFEGELPPREADHKAALRNMLTPEQVWWTCYLGKIAMMVARMYPAGVIEEAKPRARISAQWAAGLGKHGNKDGLEVKFHIAKRPNDPYMLKESMLDLLRVIEKVGKRKNWIGGKEGWGMKVKVVVQEDDEEGWEFDG